MHTQNALCDTAQVLKFETQIVSHKIHKPDTPSQAERTGGEGKTEAAERMERGAERRGGGGKTCCSLEGAGTGGGAGTVEAGTGGCAHQE